MGYVLVPRQEAMPKRSHSRLGFVLVAIVSTVGLFLLQVSCVTDIRQTFLDGPRDPLAGAPVVMVVGDSISQGREGDHTWRYRLWEWFHGNGMPVRFAGPYLGTVPPPQTKAPAPPAFLDDTSKTASVGVVHSSGGYSRAIPSNSDFFTNGAAHFSIWGRQVAQDVSLIGGMVDQYQPDYLLVELGFNDLAWWVSDANGTIANMKKFIHNARGAKSNLAFAIANVPHRSFGVGRDDLIINTERYNQALAELLNDLWTKESPLYMVQFRENFECNPSGCPAGWDGLHPNELGEYQIAKAFADTLWDTFNFRPNHAAGIGGRFEIPHRIPVRSCPPPHNVKATPSAAGVTLTWDPVHGAYGYKVRAQAGDGGWATMDVDNPRYDTRRTDAGVTWNYQVQAWCSSALSGWSSLVSATADPDYPPPPSNIFVNSTADGIEVEWESVPGYDIDRYGVYYHESRAPYPQVSGFRNASARVTGLSPGDRYGVGVETWAIVGGELVVGSSAAGAGVVVGGVMPTLPTNVKVTTTGEGSGVMLSWDDDKNAYGYRIYIRDTRLPVEAYQLVTTTASTCTHVNDLVSRAWDFEFCIAAFNGDYQTARSVCVPGPKKIFQGAECPSQDKQEPIPAPNFSPTASWSDAKPTSQTPSPTPSV